MDSSSTVDGPRREVVEEVAVAAFEYLVARLSERHATAHEMTDAIARLFAALLVTHRRAAPQLRESIVAYAIARVRVEVALLESAPPDRTPLAVNFGGPA
jgi:hypothetical protein